MEDRGIRIVAGCILVMGTNVTHCTKYYVSSQGTTMMAEISTRIKETMASSFAPALEQSGAKTDGADADMTAGRAASVASTEHRMMGDTRPGNTASGDTTSGGTGPGSTGPGNTVYVAAPTTGAAGTFSSDHTAPATTDAAEETITPDTAGSAGAVKGATVSETTSEKDMPISPLTGVRTREYKAGRIIDYHKRLEDLGIQTLKIREEEADSNMYSIKTSAETKLKLQEGELNSAYNALMETLFQKDGAKLAPEQQERLRSRDARAAENLGRSSGFIERISYAAALISLTKDRVYGLAGRYGEANGVSYKNEGSSQTTLPWQMKVWRERSIRREPKITGKREKQWKIVGFPSHFY